MNTNFTKNPIVGTPLTPSVIKQIHTAVRRYMPIAGNGIRTSVTAGGTIISAIPAPASKKQNNKPLPFEVRYDGTLDSGAGGWKIYLPTEHLVQFDGAYLDPLNDVTPILDANGDETGWYSFDEITLQDDHVWLVISESSGAHTASFANSEDQQSVANICIAELSYEEATQSTPETITINQSVVGAIVMTPVVPDDVSTEFIPDPPQGESPTGDEGKLQVKGWDNGEPLANHSLAEILSGREVTGEISPPFDRDACVVVRCTDGSLAYVQISKIFTDDASVEFKTDSTTSNLFLQVKGFDAAQTGQVPVKRNNAIAWEAQSGGADISALNGVTLVTNVEWIGSPTYAVRVSKRTATVANNTLTLGPVVTTDIATTPITDALS